LIERNLEFTANKNLDLNNLGVVGCQEVKFMQALARDGHPLRERTEFLRMHKFKKKKRWTTAWIVQRKEKTHFFK